MLANRGSAQNLQSRRMRALWWTLLVAGLLLRLWFVAHPMPHDDDTDVYADLGQNLFHHGIYGTTDDGVIGPSLIRLPGYPIFLAAVFAVFGTGNFTAVLLVQAAIDLLGCWLIAGFVREQVSARAGMVAFALAALCPFTASYASTALTESLSIFAVSLALWSTGRILHAQSEGRSDRRAIACAAAAASLAMLLRPDGALVTAAVVFAVLWYAWRSHALRSGVRTALTCALLAIVPLVPWTIRNWHTFHVIQPLAPRRVNNPGEPVWYGFYRWVSTWSVDYVSTGNVYWQVGTQPILITDLPSRAIDSPAQYAETAQLLADYHAANNMVTPALDARFNALAAERIREHPFLCRVGVPLLRVTDMLLRPRTETLGLDADWWRFPGPLIDRIETMVLGLLNVALVLAALIGLVRRRVPWPAFILAYLVLRCVLLSTMENSEPRYTLEMMPLLIACAACGLAGARVLKSRSAAAQLHTASA
ncbi:MAG TPA: glycosyltransferase family 39 protein [Acidobacteriaceae bacterium]|nr:glycosyltransferase family 39 protein [Acidobacteriaceae bacterium]